MSVFIALPVERTTHLSAKELFWDIYFEIDVLRVNIAFPRFHVTSGRQLKIFPFTLCFCFRIILSLPLLTLIFNASPIQRFHLLW